MWKIPHLKVKWGAFSNGHFVRISHGTGLRRRSSRRRTPLYYVKIHCCVKTCNCENDLFFQMRVPQNFELIVLAHLLKSKSQEKQFLKILEIKSDESSRKISRWPTTFEHLLSVKRKIFTVKIPRKQFFSYHSLLMWPRPGRFRDSGSNSLLWIDG